MVICKLDHAVYFKMHATSSLETGGIIWDSVIGSSQNIVVARIYDWQSGVSIVNANAASVSPP